MYVHICLYRRTQFIPGPIIFIQSLECLQLQIIIYIKADPVLPSGPCSLCKIWDVYIYICVYTYLQIDGRTQLYPWANAIYVQFGMQVFVFTHTHIYIYICIYRDAGLTPPKEPDMGNLHETHVLFVGAILGKLQGGFGRRKL